MYIELAEDLFHFCIEVPGAELIHLHDSIAQLLRVAAFTEGFIFLDGIDHRMIVMEDIIQHAPSFMELGLLLEEGHGHFFIDPHIAGV